MLGLYNVKDNLAKGISKYFDVCDLTNVNTEFPDTSGLLVDWVTKDDSKFGHQAVVIENYVKRGIPVVLFDRYMALTHQEYSWLSKFNVRFLEPTIITRNGFEFFPAPLQPFGTIPYGEMMRIDEEERGIKLNYQGSIVDRVKAFEKYYVEYANLYPKHKVVYFGDENVPVSKKEEWSNLTEKFSLFTQADFTIIIGSDKDYKKGYLPEYLSTILNSHCIPLLPLEHRFYGTVFRDVLFRDLKTVNFMLTTYYKVRSVIAEEIYENLVSQYPEYNLDYAVDRLKHMFTI